MIKNEKAFEGSFSIGYKNDKFKTSASATYFRIYDYIIAKTDATLVPMTIGANGVRIYTALDYATLFNSSISAEVYLSNSCLDIFPLYFNKVARLIIFACFSR